MMDSPRTPAEGRTARDFDRLAAHHPAVIAVAGLPGRRRPSAGRPARRRPLRLAVQVLLIAIVIAALAAALI